jgi:hypothetical protein
MLDSEITGSISGQLEYTTRMENGDESVTGAWNTKYKPLQQVEEYLKSRCKDIGFDLAYDVTAKEPLFFRTLNYTTYAGFLIIHPLAWEQSMRQMQDAYADGIKSKGHIDYIKSVIKDTDTFSKYSFNDTVKWEEPTEAVVVLPGGNKLKKHTCIGKLQKICDRHGDNIVLKKHPVSHDEAYQELEQALNRSVWFASPNEDLFHLMQQADYIYSSMLSETALIGHVLGKKVDHFDLLQNRDTASFIHINYYLFSHADPLKWADQTFASPKSGVVHPDIDKDWKNKIDSYLDYIMQLRSFYEDAYIWR